jgi:predicted phage terminase large subunit-like protein
VTSRDEKDLFAAIVSTDYESFCRRAFETLNGAGRLSNDPYVHVVCSEVAKIARGEEKRCIINLPPRHGKTLMGTVCLAAWNLGHNPEQPVLIISYGEDLAREIARQVRGILRANWFIQAFGSLIAKDEDRAGYFRTTKGGGLLATSFSGSYQGFGAMLIIVDDPHKVEDASSLEQLEKVCRLFETGVATRLNDPKEGRIVVVAHRIAANDLSGYLLAQGGWKHFKLPFLAEEPAEYSFEGGVWRRRRGELLRGDDFPEHEIKRRMKLAGFPDFATLWQQSPTAEELRLTAADFQLFSALPYMDSGTVLSIDTAYGIRRSSSSSVIQEWQSDRAGRHYLRDQWSGRVTSVDLRKQVLRFLNRGQVSAILVEDMGVGNALLAEVRQRVTSGVAVHAILPVGSKLERLKRVLELIRGGSVFLSANAEWLRDFLDEIEEFPDGFSDDQVDAMTQYLEWASKNPAPPRRPGSSRAIAWNARGPITPASSGMFREAGEDESPSVAADGTWAPCPALADAIASSFQTQMTMTDEIGPPSAPLEPCRPQAQRIADDAHRRQRHGGGRDDRRQEDPEERVEHARRHRHAQCVVDEGEE